jgi:hypothetical protein
MFPNPGIIVVNDRQQPIPGAQVYVDGKYVGTTSTDPGKVGRIWPSEFTPCVAHQVKAVACDGTSAIATLGYWCYPSQGATTDQGASKMLGQGTVNNVIHVFTAQCGAAGEVGAGPLPPSYSITFKESGLPEGASWCVNIGGVQPCATNYGGDSGNMITFGNVAPGTYNYTISTQSSYAPNPASGSVTVSESNPNPVVYVTFSQAAGGGGTTSQPPYQPTSSPSTGCPTGLTNDFVLQGPHGNPTDSNITLGFMVVAPSPFISGTYTVDWGDGTSSTGTWSAGAEYNINHTLPGVGTYTITLTISTSGCNALTKSWTVNVLTYQQAIAAGYQPASLTDTPGKQVSVPGICSCQCSDLPSSLTWNNQLINEIQGYIDKYYPILVSEEGQQLTASSIVAVKGPGIPNYGIMTYEDYCAATGKCLGYTTDWQPTWDGLYTADEWKSALENEISQLQSQNSEIESAMRTQCGYAI